MISALVRLLTLIALPLALVWFLVSPAFDSALALIAGISGVLVPLLPHERKSKAGDSPNRQVATLAQPVAAEPTYSERIGERLRYLRESILLLSLREMAEFLGTRTVTEVEQFEKGEFEYPLVLIEKIENFFHINPGFFETGNKPIFLHFSLEQETVNQYFAESYTPFLICASKERESLLCYQIFVKKINGFTQIVCADRAGSFSSSGGGKINIGFLINALLDAGAAPSTVRILQATAQEWDAIEEGKYYAKHPFSRFGSADWQCQDIFGIWYKEYAQARTRWKAPN